MANRIAYEERKAIYEMAIGLFGSEHQINKFDEELGEFLAEFARIRNNEGDIECFAEEMADLLIMLEQLRLIFGVNEKVGRYMDMKVMRLQRRMSAATGSPVKVSDLYDEDGGEIVGEGHG